MIGNGGASRPVLLRDPDDGFSLLLDLDEAAGRGGARVEGSDAELAELSLARGYAALFLIDAPHDATTTADALRAGAEPDERRPGEARVPIPGRMRGIVVSSVVFGRPVEAMVMAGSNRGAVLMALERAANEFLTHPARQTRVGGCAGGPLPLHPEIVEGVRLCVDPVRNSSDEPWTWALENVDELDPDAATLHWHDGAGEDGMRGWYLMARRADGEAAEITGPVRDDADAVLTALADMFPGMNMLHDEPGCMSGLAGIAIGKLNEAAEGADDDAGREKRLRAAIEQRAEAARKE